MVAVQAIIVNESDQILLLSPPNGAGVWQVVSGALEAKETILEGTLRETREEAGQGVTVCPLGTVHVQTFHNVRLGLQYAVSVYYLLAYEGGEIQPGDDMRGSQYRWWDIEELMGEGVKISLPPQKWILRRAIELYRLWKLQDVDLQPVLDMT
jgi:ADP-ribose pyrophosphatase YjhB (NUDIX family)